MSRCFGDNLKFRKNQNVQNISHNTLNITKYIHNIVHFTKYMSKYTTDWSFPHGIAMRHKIIIVIISTTSRETVLVLTDLSSCGLSYGHMLNPNLAYDLQDYNLDPTKQHQLMTFPNTISSSISIVVSSLLSSPSLLPSLLLSLWSSIGSKTHRSSFDDELMINSCSYNTNDLVFN